MRLGFVFKKSSLDRDASPGHRRQPAAPVPAGQGPGLLRGPGRRAARLGPLRRAARAAGGAHRPAPGLRGPGARRRRAVQRRAPAGLSRGAVEAHRPADGHQ